MKRIFAVFIIILLFKSVSAQKQNGVTSPYTPLVVKDKTILLSGKQVDLNADGFPAMIQTFFNPEMTAITTTPKNLVTEPIHFHITKSANHKDIRLKSGEITFTAQKPEMVSWTAKNTSDSLTMDVEGSIKFDGLLIFTVKITAVNDIDLDNIRLHLPITPEAAKYIKGFGQAEALRPDLIDWKWSGTDKNESIRISDVNGGLQYMLSDHQSGKIPSSWSNEGKGGIKIAQKGKAILADSYSGLRLMKKGDVVYYNFTLLITPDHLTGKAK